MAQRASNVKWNGNYVFGSTALLQKPDHAALVAATVAAWAATEQHFGIIFCSLIGAKQPVTLSMYAAVRSPEAQRDILKTACTELLPKTYARVAVVCVDQLYSLAKERHHFAHWIWGASADPNLDALILVEPRHFWTLEVAKNRYWRKNATGGFAPTPPGVFINQPRLSRDDMHIYKLNDLKAAHERMNRAFWMADALNKLVGPLNTSERRAIYQWLSAQPDIQKALSREKTKALKNRQAPPVPPRIIPQK